MIDKVNQIGYTKIKKLSKTKKKKRRSCKQMKEMTFNQLEGMTVEALSIRGKGVFLEQSCSYVGISEYGTNKEKAKRLLAWRDKKLLK